MPSIGPSSAASARSTRRSRSSPARSRILARCAVPARWAKAVADDRVSKPPSKSALPASGGRSSLKSPGSFRNGRIPFFGQAAAPGPLHPEPQRRVRSLENPNATIARASGTGKAQKNGMHPCALKEGKPSGATANAASKPACRGIFPLLTCSPRGETCRTLRVAGASCRQ